MSQYHTYVSLENSQTKLEQRLVSSDATILYCRRQDHQGAELAAIVHTKPVGWAAKPSAPHDEQMLGLSAQPTRGA